VRIITSKTKDRRVKPNLLYFGYGSNLNIEQMEWRCPGARPIGPASLDGYKLEFRANATGYGYLTVAPDAESMVAGGLWEIRSNHVATLDSYEGYPSLYYRRKMVVWLDTGHATRALVYIMTPGHVLRMPTQEYIRTCARGLNDFGLDTGALRIAIGDAWKEMNQRKGAGVRWQAQQAK
jgi:gamma-glutamylcyclotransferase (GGCT)/AIG2-like uncharacterized protein YtfP